MRELSCEELVRLQSVEKDVLTEFSNYCSRNSLRWQVAYGSLLGAIRHKGFIPWDDDVDVAMPYEDYLKIIHEYNFNPTDGFVVQSYLNDPYHLLPWAKLRYTKIKLIEIGAVKDAINGVFIDIFPIFNISKNKLIQFIVSTRIRILSSCAATTVKKSSFIKKVVIKFLSFFLRPRTCLKKIHKIYDRCNKRYKDSGVVFMSNVFTPLNKEWIARTVKTKFDEIEALIPVGYDEVLKNRYGNYMSLPSKEDRIPHHFLEQLDF